MRIVYICPQFFVRVTYVTETLFENVYVRICAGTCVYIPPNKRSFARTAIDQARNRADRGMIFPRKIAPVHFVCSGAFRQTNVHMRAQQSIQDGFGKFEG